MLKHLLCLTLCLSLLWQLQGQSTYNQIARDTIVRIPAFLGSTYLLNGKKMNLQVMEWFMSDYPQVYDQIRLAVLSDQVSIVGYTFGGLFCLTGLLIHPEDQRLGNSMLKVGAVGIGSGITFQIISGNFQRKAVRAYNSEIKAVYQKQDMGVRLNISQDGLTLGLKF